MERIHVDGIPVQPGPGTYALRIGRHVGAESITVIGHRNIRIMLGRDKKDIYQDRATTFWLASDINKNPHNHGLRPFGWTVLDPLTAELNKQLDAEEDDYAYREMLADKKRLDDAAQREEQALREKQEAENLQREKEEAEKREKERQSALEAMSPEERDIVTLEDPGVIENTIVEILNRLDDFEDDNKIRAAGAIKAYYKKNNKWKVNKKKEKQFQKIQKIKTILGE